nr:hypothetical protein [Cressdnaviricota sp.]
MVAELQYDLVGAQLTIHSNDPQWRRDFLRRNRELQQRAAARTRQSLIPLYNTRVTRHGRNPKRYPSSIRRRRPPSRAPRTSAPVALAEEIEGPRFEEIIDHDEL